MELLVRTEPRKGGAVGNRAGLTWTLFIYQLVAPFLILNVALLLSSTSLIAPTQ
jgi:hypothetical protein